MEKILGSSAFNSLEGKSHIQELLNQETQNNVSQALDQLIESKITEYTSSQDENQKDGGKFNVGDQIQLSFNSQSTDDYKNAKL